MDIFQAILMFIIGFFAGGQILLNALRNLSERELNKHHLPKNDFANHLNVEKINDLYYIFDIKNDVFVCQGKTLHETLATVSDRGINRALITFDDQRFIIKDGNIIEVTNQS